jgi:hypothetical protein
MLSATAQKSPDNKSSFLIGLSYHVYQFLEEDAVVNPEILEDGEFKDGLIGFNFQYIYGFNRIIGACIDYKFLMGAFDRAFREYIESDFAYGHQIFIGPSLNIGRGVVNLNIRPQIGFDFLKIKGIGDWESSSSGGYIHITYTGSSGIEGMWTKILDDYANDGTTILNEGYPAYIRKNILYQAGINLNFTFTKTSFTIFTNFTPIHYNGEDHDEFDAGLGASFHF